MVVTLTFITACASYHAHLIPAVRAQVERQTIPCAHILVEDSDRRGSGWARNQGLAQVTSEFVAFLDADDALTPTWAAETLAAFQQHGGRRYIYTDHIQDGKVVPAPDCAWVNKTWHVITALLPTAWARRAGGFDETLPAFEDTDLYLRLLSLGYCGARLARPLFEYGAGGKRSAAHDSTPIYDAAMRYFTAQYGGHYVGSCCGDPIPGDLIPVGERLEGDVLAQAAWTGNRPERGAISGRIYRTGSYKRTWVDPRDVEAKPHLWRIVRSVEEAPDFEFASFADYAIETGDDGGVLEGVEAIAQFIMAEQQPPADYQPPPEAVRVDAAPTADKPSAATLRTKAEAGRRRAGRQQTRVGSATKGAGA